MSALIFENLGFTYPNGKKIFENLSFSVQPNSMVGILGPNGCGKSTLFRILTKSHMPHAGSILLNGKNILEDNAFTNIGYVFQHMSLDPILTVNENLFIQGKLYSLDSSTVRQRIEELSMQLDFKGYLHERVQSLSGGLARRVEIAKAMIHHPTLILLDEPSANLDPKSRLDLFDWMRKIQQEYNATVLWVTHLTEEAQKMDQVVLFHEGKIVSQGNPFDLVQVMDFYVLSAKAQDEDVVEKLEKYMMDVHLSGDQIQFRIHKKDLQEVLPIMLPCVQHLTYREPNLEDLYLEKTGVLFA